ncbi:hypothetical protein CONPUDRAFT_56307 [Coniophora puteana RWD-64-598 SS2]|uniref:Protein-S-isoprenylcysteine O-methyltransferase n=1 Tax=Coniophora puteana (strain RWD-64-598) TaxID=741705 RepID=A0A5M3MR45_CONPW|nr:uncharacterized protein CONPUDRAFT_56307 [Coniophora puteana RWD-64-598 SS2]EIW81527.1 hypothetical protein CONPUDRAFT_56307 [Coniophora puteana RWD-64-598 SS2]
MSWLKAGLQIAAVTAFNISLTNPNPSESTRKSLKTSDFKKPRFDDLIIRALVPLSNVGAPSPIYFLRRLTLDEHDLCKLAIILPVIAETLIAVALSFPSSPYTPKILALLGHNPLTSTPTPSPLYTAGAVLTVLGSIARVHCFRVLGKHFTFNIGILKDHALVTSGPYSYVRHPSYACMILQIASLVLMHAAPDSGADACKAVRVAVALLWGFSASCLLKLAVERPPVEDEFLHKEFGKEWEEYSRRVKYRLIPGVY